MKYTLTLNIQLIDKKTHSVHSFWSYDDGYCEFSNSAIDGTVTNTTVNKRQAPLWANNLGCVSHRKVTENQRYSVNPLLTCSFSLNMKSL